MTIHTDNPNTELSAAERHKILVEWNNTQTDYPKDKCIHQLFEAQVEQTPNAIAVVFEEQQLTYDELNCRANQLAHHLQSLGVKPEVLVGICVERSLEMVVGLLAILKAGGAYVPLDPNYPKERLAFMLADAGVPVLLTPEKLVEGLPEHEALIVCLETSLENLSKGNPVCKVTPENLVYVIYTSGSTGIPKGVTIQQSSILNLASALYQTVYSSYQNQPLLRVSLNGSLAFDTSVKQIIQLLYGHILVIIPESLRFEGTALLNYIRDRQIDVFDCTPSQLGLLISAGLLSQSASTPKTVLIGGEPINESTWQALAQAEHLHFYNVYGPTECTVDATLCEVRTFLKPVIGRPLANVQTYILDCNLQPVSIGEKGELYIGGAGLARGYLNSPELTLEKFLPNPFSDEPDARLYKTGDLACYLPDGNIEFLGRIDSQVKYRGFRIELGEIETKLAQHPDVQEAVVIVWENVKGDKRLVGYIVPNSSRSPTIAGQPRYTLPNNLAIAHLNQNETDFLYKEIFEVGAYLKHGITIQDGDCIFDVGTNIGLFTLFAHLSGNNVKLYGFEPNPDVFEKLKLNTALYGVDAKLFNCGLSAETKTANFTFYPQFSFLSGLYADADDEKKVVKSFLHNQVQKGAVASLAQNDNSLEELLAYKFKSETFEVQLRRLSDIIKENQVEHIDLLKINVEKSELDVLAGIDEADWRKIHQIALEVHDIDGRLDQVITLFEKQGYHTVVEQDWSLDETAKTNYYIFVIKDSKQDLKARQPANQTINHAIQKLAEPILTANELHHFLEKQLPDYMVPAIFVMLEKLPLTPNGKIDRNALPIPDSEKGTIDKELVAAHTPFEELLTTIWTEVLALKKIGIHDNFLALGGHSLLITQVISRVRETLLELPISSLFDYPTIAELAQHIEMLLRQKPNLQQAPAIQPISRQQNLPLSYLQEQLWFLAQLNPNVPFYNESATIHINSTLNVVALSKSLNEIIKRHEALRTIFARVSGQPVQKVMLPPTFNLPVVDLRTLPLEQREVEAMQLATKQAKQLFELFDFTQDILLRATLVRLAKAKYRLFLTIHHIIIDGVSLAIFLKELAVLYEAFSTGMPSPLLKLPIQYVDFADWQRQQLSEDILASQLSYWKPILGDNLPVLQLPTSQKRPVTPTFRGAKQYLVLSKNLTEELKTLSQQEGVTLFMTMLAAFKTLLYRYTGQDDIVVGTVAAVRNRPELEHLMGYLLNTLVLRTSVSGRPTFQQFLAQVREVTLSAYAHNDLPFEKLVEALQTERHLGQNPLFQVAFSLDPSMPEIDLGWALTQSDIDNGTAKFDLSLGLEEKPECISGRIEYSTDLFEAHTIVRMIGHFQTLLEGIVANPGLRISELPLLTERERHQLLVEWNETQTDYPKDKCIHHLFEAQVEKTPEAVAVVFEDKQLTYQELNSQANQLAHSLQTLGLKPEVLVGICVERSIEMVIGLFGILKAGGAYLPLDPALPKERLAFMLEDALVPVLLTEQNLVDKLPSSQAQMLCLDSDWKTISQHDDDNYISEVKPENLAYVIYTSGSTGKPKGVMIAHKGLCNLAQAQIQLFKVQPSSRVLQFASLSFDASIWEIIMALCSGAKLCLGTALPGPALIQQLSTITHVTLPPTALAALPTEKLPELQCIIVAGEACSQDLAAQWSENRHVFNAYGPTESTVCATVFKYQGERQKLFIGCPIANTKIYLLDSNLQLVPIGVPCELHLGGVSLARGYLNRPELTANKFIPNPFNDDECSRLYQTGDLVRYLPDGNIEFIGRIDNQVKIRCFRIDLGEIETILVQHPDVREVAVIAREEQLGDKRLVAYFVPNHPTRGPTASSLRHFLKEKLPDYMIPAAFVILEAMPLTPNGKIDRRALSQLSLDSCQLSEKTFVAPREALELQLTRIWEEVLDVYPVGVQDNFFELGGHSLLAVRLMAEIQQQFGKNISIATLFQGATIEQLAKLIRQQTTDSQAWSPLVAIQPLGPKRPFFCMPGSGGNVIYFHHLARHLGTERPFYALQARGLDGESAPFTCVEYVAAYYLEAIRTVQPQGPYFLGGHSFGALVAFEMAQQLHRQGQQVALLAILDLPALRPEREPIELDWDNAQWMATIAHILESLSGKTLGLSSEDFQALDADAQLTLLSARLEKANLLPKEAGINYVRSLVQVIKADELAFLRYVPPADYPNQITLFKTREGYPDEFGTFGDILDEPDWGWGRLSTEPVEVIMVLGSHTTMLTEPDVQVLADKLRHCLDKVIVAKLVTAFQSA